MKYLSSIFSFETLNLKPKNVFSTAIKLVLACFLLIEVSLRFFVPSGHSPAGHWKNQMTRVKAKQIEELNNIDLLFTGSSVSSVNVPPESFDDELKKNGVNITSYNTGIAGTDWEGVAAAFEKLFWKEQKAQYVVLIISPYDLDESNTVVRERTSSFVESLNIPLYEAAAVDLFSKIWIFGFRNEIREFLKTFRWQSEPPSVVSVRGYTPMYKGCTHNLEFPVNIDKDGNISKAVLNLVGMLTGQGVKVVIVEALLNSKLRKYNENKLENFYSVLDEMKKYKNTVFLDVSGIIPDDKYFIDPFHLNVEGSHAYARNLARQLICNSVINTHK